MDLCTWIILFILLLMANIVSDIAVFGIQSIFVKKKPQVTPYNKDAMAGLLSELNMLIDIEFLSIVEAPNVIRQVDIIGDFEKVQTELTKNVLNSLSTSFFLRANQAGLKQEYVMTYVTRKSTMVILEYMREHNFSLKK